VLRGFVANIPSEPEAQGPEEDPSKPDIYSAGELTAELNRVIDVAVGGIVVQREAAAEKVKEQFTFGAELEKQLSGIGNLGEAMTAIYKESLGSDTEVTPGKIDVTNQTFSFIVSRPVDSIFGRRYSHSYIVVGAKYLGDMNENVEFYSYGKGANGNLIRQRTSSLFENEKKTAELDMSNWAELVNISKLEVQQYVQLIPAKDEYVRAYAEAFSEELEYDALAPLLNGSNCNSAVQAIVQAAANSEIPMPTIRKALGSEDINQIRFNLIQFLQLNQDE
ncbi:hypothetical protein KKF55_00170, partial [Patescibacteria group bacterium]|nr:hypothetical protein [Patescibacteria group bacterium]